MRTSVALCTALAVTLATGAPIVRVVHFEDFPVPVTAEALSTDSQLSPPVRQEFTTEIVVNNNGLAPEDGFRHGLRKHHGPPFHHGHRRHRQPWMRLLAWLFPSAHTGPKRFGPYSSMTQEEVGGRPRPHHHPTTAELEMEGARPSYRYLPCPRHGGRHGGRHFYRVRKYADMAIISIVFTFIGVVLLIELWGPISRRFNNSESGEGYMQLPDEEKLIPAPGTLAFEPEVVEKSGSSDDASAEKAEQS